MVEVRLYRLALLPIAGPLPPILDPCRVRSPFREVAAMPQPLCRAVALLAILVAMAALSGPVARAASVDEGLRAARLGDYDRAVAEFRALADAGDARAQYLLGLCYRQGKGVPPDPATAARWFEKAAAAGDVDAQSALGTMYLIGEGVTPEPERAFGLLSTAAAAGDRRAKFGLGVMYEAGLGRQADIGKALDWYNAAAEQGLIDAQLALAQIYDAGQSVPRDLARAARWYTRAANQGNGRAQYGLGTMYLRGEGVAADEIEAYKWFALATASLPPGDEHDLAERGRSLVAGGLGADRLAEAERRVTAFAPRLEFGEAAALEGP
jgi:TPR repeat protein